MTTWKLDTENDGRDETLHGATYEEVLEDILHYHEIGELPAHWTLYEWEEEDSDDGPIRDGTQGGSAMTGREF